VNLILEWDTRERLEACLEEGVRLVSFFWGDPAPYVPAVHETGGIVLQTVGSVAEARRAVAAGVDVLVAQGVEAGGHVRGAVSTMVLVPHLRPVPAARRYTNGCGNLTERGGSKRQPLTTATRYRRDQPTAP
jgi:NAD(P)H-dependent flavin oxidoreductase YrpB (nitropropane dioxygenase family)